MVEHYLNLEKLNHDFEYEIHMDDQVSEACLVPAMMIQPLVENAVLHGISPLKEKGRIRLNFTLCSEKLLLCTIEDNGIGLKAAKEAQKKSVHQHKSKAIEIIVSRLELIQNEAKENRLVIKEGEQGFGTIVEVKLPIKL